MTCKDCEAKPIDAYEVTLCPLHEAAPDLLAALEEIHALPFAAWAQSRARDLAYVVIRKAKGDA